MQTPSEKDFSLAIAWLEEYDGDTPNDRAASLRVAKYLERMLQNKEIDRQSKLLAKEFGVSAGKIKKHLKHKLKERANGTASNI